MSAPVEIRGCTLWQPWATAIALGPKRTENRGWKIPRRLLDVELWLALHAGKKWDGAGFRVLSRLWPACPPRECHAFSGIVAVARVARCVRTSEIPATDEFASGPWCWLLEDVVALPWLVPCHGAQGLWRLPPTVEQVVRPRCVRRIATASAS